MKYLYLLPIVLLLLLSGCGDSDRPGNLIEEDTYINLLVELQLVKSHIQSSKIKPGVADSLERVIYDKYDITRDQFLQSHHYYQKQSTEQKKRLDEAIERLKMDKVRKQNSDSVQTSGQQPSNSG